MLRVSTVLATLLLITACEQDRIAPEPRLTLDVYEVGQPVVTRERKFNGQVVPADLTRVSFRVPGKILQLDVQAGQPVVAGQTLARIEDTIQKQVLVDAKAQYQLSKRQLERAENLHQRGSLTAAQRDQLQAGFRLSRANLRLAQAGLSYTVVQAPFDGTVAEVDKELYEEVVAGEPVVSVYRSGRTDVLVNIPDTLPAQLHQARDLSTLNLQVVFSGSPDVHQMKVLKGSTARHPDTQAFQLWITMATPGDNFPPGLPVTVTMDLRKAGFSTQEGYVVPLNALQAAGSENSFRVWRYQDGVVDPVPVKVGRISQQGALILSGLHSGDLVATSALSRLGSGQVVNIKIQEQGQ